MRAVILVINTEVNTMVKTINIEGYECHLAQGAGATELGYLLYPALVPFEDRWLERMAGELNVSLVTVYVPADDWNNVLTPWPEPPEAKGFPPFDGKAGEFLTLLQTKIIPQVEENITGLQHRDLIGVSLGGLFTLWQWMGCDTFRSIASLSGSFWYPGFIDWFSGIKIPSKEGKAYFLLGEEEPKAHVKAYQSVGVNTERIVERFKSAGIAVEFEWVPGNHFSRPVHRAERALRALYS